MSPTFLVDLQALECVEMGYKPRVGAAPCSKQDLSWWGVVSGGSQLCPHPLPPPRSCDETGTYWYRDNRCKSRVSKLAVGLGSAVAVLATTVAVLTIFLFRERRNRAIYR